MNKINPIGLKGQEVTNRMKQLMGVAPVESKTSNSVVEISKLGPDGNVYAIVRENHEYYIKIANNDKKLTVESFNYIGGLQNKKKYSYPSYAQAIKQLNLKFISLNEALEKSDSINVFVNDKLVTENFYSVDESLSDCCGAKINEGMCSECGASMVKEEEIEDQTDEVIDEMVSENTAKKASKYISSLKSKLDDDDDSINENLTQLEEYIDNVLSKKKVQAKK